MKSFYVSQTDRHVQEQSRGMYIQSGRRTCTRGMEEVLRQTAMDRDKVEVCTYNQADIHVPGVWQRHLQTDSHVQGQSRGEDSQREIR